MHGLMMRSVQCFICDTYGQDTWLEVVAAAGLGFDNFEALMRYDEKLCDQLIEAAVARLEKPREELFEDLGTYLASHPNMENLRRLLRFGGETFVEFLYSLDELPDRSRLAVPDLDLPALDLRDHSPTNLTLAIAASYPGIGHVMAGVLRAMADDYGTLALLEHVGRSGDAELITIQLMDVDFSDGRAFDLALGVG
ncbi:MAG: heme NO-binding domain-containing protein [Paracoccaceae bacterium]